MEEHHQRQPLLRITQGLPSTDCSYWTSCPPPSRATGQSGQRSHVEKSSSLLDYANEGGKRKGRKARKERQEPSEDGGESLVWARAVACGRRKRELPDVAARSISTDDMTSSQPRGSNPRSLASSVWMPRLLSLAGRWRSPTTCKFIYP